MKTHIESDRWGRRERLVALVVTMGILLLIALLLSLGTAEAAPAAGNRGGCGRANMVLVTCNVSDAGVGFVSGGCEWGHWFSRVSTRRTFRVGEVVNVYGCEGEHAELYAPIRISR